MMDMGYEVRTFCFHGAFCNSHLLIKGEECLLVDPGFNEGHLLEKEIEKSGKRLRAILLTHGHFDHFAGLRNWENLGQIPVFIAQEDERNLKDAHRNVSEVFLGYPIAVDVKPYLLEDEDEIRIGGFLLKVIATPFHTEGSVCFYLEDGGILFSGDTLFQGSIGRYDLPGSDPGKIVSSLEKLKKLPPAVAVYPGHGPKTTIKDEFSGE